MTGAEYRQIIEAVIRQRQTDEAAKRVWLLAEKLRREGW